MLGMGMLGRNATKCRLQLYRTGEHVTTELVRGQHVSRCKHRNRVGFVEDFIQAVVVIVGYTSQVLSTALIMLIFGAAANVTLEKSKKLINCMLEIRKRLFIVFIFIFARRCR